MQCVEGVEQFFLGLIFILQKVDIIDEKGYEFSSDGKGTSKEVGVPDDRVLAAEEKSNVTPHRSSFMEKLKDYISPGKSE